MFFSKIFASAIMATMAAAQTVHVVSVGSTDSDKALSFSPNKVDAAQGDMIQFQFRALNHTVTQSNFDNPCMPIGLFTNKTGIYSGFQPVGASEPMGMIPTYTVQVADTKPMWFYCSQGRHCQNGMVMVVNENTSANSTRSLENFVQLASSAGANLPGDATSIDEGIVGTTPSNQTDIGTGNGAGTDGSTPDADATPGADGADSDGTIFVGAAAGLSVPGTFIALGAIAALLF